MAIWRGSVSTEMLVLPAARVPSSAAWVGAARGGDGCWAATESEHATIVARRNQTERRMRGLYTGPARTVNEMARRTDDERARIRARSSPGPGGYASAEALYGFRLVVE